MSAQQEPQRVLLGSTRRGVRVSSPTEAVARATAAAMRPVLVFQAAPVLTRPRACVPSATPRLSARVAALKRAGVVTLVPRRHDYDAEGPEPRPYCEPELVVIVATSHMAGDVAAEAVRTVVSDMRPEAVVVELCRSRAGMLYEPAASPLGMSGEGPFRAVLERALALGGGPALIVRALLARFVEKSAAGRAVGLEFKAARDAAVQCGAEVVLGDRPIECTLRRAWQALNLRHRALFLVVLARGAIGLAPSVDDLEDDALRNIVEGDINADANVLDRYMQTLADSFPALVKPLVSERDMYLAWSLKRSQAVSGCKCVVGVVGRAHVNGILDCLRQDDEYRRLGKQPPLTFRDLVG